MELDQTVFNFEQCYSGSTGGHGAEEDPRFLRPVRACAPQLPPFPRRRARQISPGPLRAQAPGQYGYFHILAILEGTVSRGYRAERPIIQIGVHYIIL